MASGKKIGRNPYGERKKALAFEDLKVGMKVVVIGGGLYYHEHATIASKPYQRTGPGISNDPRMIGKPGEIVQVTRWFIKVKNDSAPFRESTLPSWYNDMQAGYKKSEKEWSLVDMGLVPDREGRWSLRYTVRLEDYDPRGLHS